MLVRPYRPEDYVTVKALYEQGDLYGGQFDEDRDSQERLDAVCVADPQAILVCELNSQIIGTVSLIENARVAWLFRFAAVGVEAAQTLYKAACEILSARGHRQVLVYSQYDHKMLDQRYADLGMNKGAPYTCFWAPLI